MSVSLCTRYYNQVCVVQDTQSSSQAPAVPVLKPGESPLRWSNTNPQVRPTFVYTHSRTIDSKLFMEMLFLAVATFHTETLTVMPHL